MSGVRSRLTRPVDGGDPLSGLRLDDAARRRRLVLETVLVLSVSLGQSAVSSLLSLIDKLTVGPPLSSQTTTINVSRAPDRPWLDFSWQVYFVVFGVMPALLAVFLLATTTVPRGGVSAALGTSPRRLGFDWGWGATLFVGIGVPGIGLYLGARALSVNTDVSPANLTAHWWTTPVLIALAAMNGVLEEIVMVGYLFTRWAQAGARVWTIVLVSAAVRGSYHLYQGFGGFVGNLIMGVIFGLFYVKTRRVWPLVIAHTLLDVASFVGYSWLKGHVHRL